MNNNISHVVIEGCDGVGKSTLLFGLQKKFNRIGPSFRDRGELSDFVYAKKFGRSLVSVNQCHLPILYVLITKTEDEIRKQLERRAQIDLIAAKDLSEELDAIKDQRLFMDVYHEFKVDHHIITCDLTGKSIDESIDFVYDEINIYIDSLPKDCADSTTHFILSNAACKKQWRFYSIDGQPYFNSKMAILDPDKHNGVYETVTDKTYPISLMYAAEFEPYVKDCEKFDNNVAVLDNRLFLNKREVMLKEHTDDVFQAMRDYIDIFNSASCIVYYTRYAYRHGVSPLLYLAAMSNTVIFFDQKLTRQIDIYEQIYKNHEELINYVTFASNDSLKEKKKAIFDNENVEKAILFVQKQWYLDNKTQFL
jgi:hypothetical protein